MALVFYGYGPFFYGKVQLLPPPEGEVVVSRERVPDFKGWLDK